MIATKPCYQDGYIVWEYKEAGGSTLPPPPPHSMDPCHHYEQNMEINPPTHPPCESTIIHIYEQTSTNFCND